MKDSDMVPAENVAKKIFHIRGQKVMLSPDLAELYQVEPRILIQAVKRNRERFPEDFMFQLTWEEVSLLKSQIIALDGIAVGHSRSQIVILKQGRNIKYLPFAFTEQGVAMLSSVLRSKRAIEVNILIMRAFVRLREMIATNKNLARRLDDLEKKYDGQFQVVFEAIRQLMTPPEIKKRKIGFQLKEKQVRYGRKGIR